MQQAANLQQATILQAAALSAATQNVWNQPPNASQSNISNDLSKSATDAQQNWMQQWYFIIIFRLFFVSFEFLSGSMLVMMLRKLLLTNNGIVVLLSRKHTSFYSPLALSCSLVGKALIVSKRQRLLAVILTVYSNFGLSLT